MDGLLFKYGESIVYGETTPIDAFLKLGIDMDDP